MSDFRFDGTALREDLTFDTFGCNPFTANPETPDRVKPDIVIVRAGAVDIAVTAPDGRQIKMWSFETPKAFPAPPIRVRQNQIVHTRLEAKKGAHTIHHHGLAMTPFNDGVGHTSFEVTGDYTYQWCPSQAGTYFYHCHKNTVLHFEMGMYGLIIVDPPEGRGTAFSGGPRYDVEALWIADDIDPRWHELNHSAGMCGEDVGFDRFEPRYFLISGAFAPRTMTDQRAVVHARAGQRILIRLLNASYSILRTTLELDATIIAQDGKPLGQAPWNRPIHVPAGQPFELTTANRYDLLVTVPRTGRYTARMEFLDWITRQIQDGGRGVAETCIIATS